MLQMDLVIKYDNGLMTVRLEEFLGQRSISKFRKLVKLINSSHTPELLDDMESYILNQLEQFKQQKQEYENMVIGYENSLVGEESRQELTHLNSCVSNYKQKINNCIRNKDFYSKCIEIIS